MSDVQILSEKSEAVAAKVPPYQNANIEKSDENKLTDRETRTAHTTVIPKPVIDSNVSDSAKAVSPAIPTESLKADDDLVSKEEKEGEEPTNCENTSDKSYYNTLCKRVPVSRLSEYVRNKDHDDLVEEFYVSISCKRIQLRLWFLSIYRKGSICVMITCSCISKVARYYRATIVLVITK